MEAERTMVIEVNVTRNHILMGIRAHGKSCPIALACKEHFKKPVSVGHNFVSVSKKEAYAHNRTNEIIRFDLYGPDHVSPFTVRLERV